MKKRVSVLLSLALVLSVFTFAPQTARADDATTIANTINNFAHGGTGTLAASATGNTVTVTGRVTGATADLALTLDNGVTVDWQAEYSGSAGILLLIRMSGGTGALLVSGGWIENTGSGNAIHTQNFDVRITVSGSARVSSASGRAISADYASAQITVSGGTVSSSSGIAISASGNNARVTVSGGTVSSASGRAISAGNAGTAQVTVSGGTVSADAGGEPAIDIRGTLSISGGKVDVANSSAAWPTITASNIAVSGGDVIAANGGSESAISSNGALTITGGRVLANAGGSDLYGGIAGISIGGGAVVGYDVAATNGSFTINTAGGSAIAYKPGGAPNVTVTASPIGSGTASVSFTDARGNTVTSANFWEDSFVPVVAAANPGYVFTGWTSTTAGVTFTAPSSLSTSFTMPAGTADATANFTDLRITGFAIAGQIGQTAINHATGTITVTMPYGTSLSALTPTITIPAGASVNPASSAAQDFSNAVQYTVTNGGQTKTYTVTVTAAPPPYSGGDSYTPSNTLRIVGNPRVTLLSGTSARLGVQASGGNPPYTYQWQYIGSWIDIPGATSAEFDWTDLTPGQAYTVRCVVKDRSGATVISPEKTFIAGEGLSAFPIKGEITSKNVNVRPNANTKGTRLGRLQIGDEVSILGYTAPKGYAHGFYKIAWDNAAGFAYISADYVSVTFTTPLGAAITGRVYLQSRMNTAKKYRVATLSNGDTAKLLGRYKTWWVVEWQGEKAYLKNGKYIQP